MNTRTFDNNTYEIIATVDALDEKGEVDRELREVVKIDANSVDEAMLIFGEMWGNGMVFYKAGDMDNVNTEIELISRNPSTKQTYKAEVSAIGKNCPDRIREVYYITAHYKYDAQLCFNNMWMNNLLLQEVIEADDVQTKVSFVSKLEEKVEKINNSNKI